MTNRHNHGFSRRDFVKAVTGAIASSVVANGFPSIVPASVLKGKGPSNRINVGAIGTGRIYVVMTCRVFGDTTMRRSSPSVTLITRDCKKPGV
jgi:hypothetical protein